MERESTHGDCLHRHCCRLLKGCEFEGAGFGDEEGWNRMTSKQSLTTASSSIVSQGASKVARQHINSLNMTCRTAEKSEFTGRVLHLAEDSHIPKSYGYREQDKVCCEWK